MKPYALHVLLALFLISGSTAYGQSGIPAADQGFRAYIAFWVAYADGQTEQILGYEDIYKDEDDFCRRPVSASYGQGFAFGAEAGYYVYEGFSPSIQVAYTLGKEHTIESENVFFGETYRSTETFQGTQLTLSPKINYDWDCDDSPVSASAGFGPSIGVVANKKYTWLSTADNAFSNTETHQEEKWKTGIGVGLTGNVAVYYDVTDNVSVGIYSGFEAINYWWKTSEVTMYNNVFMDKFSGFTQTTTLDDLTDQQINTDFVQKIDQDTEFPDDKSIQLSERASYGSWRIGVSARYRF